MRSLKHLAWAVAILSLTAGPAGPAGADETGPAKATVGEVIVVVGTHFDIGDTGLAKNVVQRHRTGMIDQVPRVVDEPCGRWTSGPGGPGRPSPWATGGFPLCCQRTPRPRS